MKNVILYGIAFAALVAVGVSFSNSLGYSNGFPRRFLPNLTTQVTQGLRLSGEIVEDRRTLDSFDSILLPGSGKVTVRIGDTASVLVRADRALLPSVDTRVQGNNLVLGMGGSIASGIAGITSASRVEYEVTVPSLRNIKVVGAAVVQVLDPIRGKEFSVEIAGSGSVQANLEVESFSASILGSGDVEMRGRTERLDLKVLGSGDLKAKDLAGASASIAIMGSGDVDVGTFKDLNITIAGSGDVTYAGKPSIKSSLPGSGKIKER